jgi:cytochrome P450 / NADPH-cytochrome P450 reductase
MYCVSLKLVPVCLIPHRGVGRVLAFFGLAEKQHVRKAPSPLPVDKEISVLEVLSGYVELSQRATRDIKKLVALSEGNITTSKLEGLLSNYQELVLEKRISVLDILEKHKASIKISFGEFLDMLPSMRIRQYSISSSPLWNAEHVTLTVSVINFPSLSGDAEKAFLGVASNYLAQLKSGDPVLVSVRPLATAFSPSQDPSISMIIFCAGSGLAPMRGFIQERV